MKSSFCFVLFSLSFLAKTTYSQSLVHHTTNWFGPNANPIPIFTDATIPNETRMTPMADFYYGSGDQTQAIYFQVEVPIIKKWVSLKTWTSFERFSVNSETKKHRGMLDSKGNSFGDIYVQSRFQLVKEKKHIPAILLNITLKTASGGQFSNRRYFNTAGYYFDSEIGKSYLVQSSILQSIRWVLNVGFFSWDVQTPGLNVQDDAFMYGAKLILKNRILSWENTYSGYSGWIDRHENYGNKPVSITSKLLMNLPNNQVFIQYQHGIRHFPYKQIRFGIDIPVKFLTPKQVSN